MGLIEDRPWLNEVRLAQPGEVVRKGWFRRLKKRNRRHVDAVMAWPRPKRRTLPDGPILRLWLRSCPPVILPPVFGVRSNPPTCSFRASLLLQTQGGRFSKAIGWVGLLRKPNPSSRGGGIGNQPHIFPPYSPCGPLAVMLRPSFRSSLMKNGGDSSWVP